MSFVNFLKVNIFLSVLSNNVTVGVLDSVLKQFKDSSKMAIKIVVLMVLQNPLIQTSRE